MVEAALTRYPDVADEFETIKKVIKGYNIARFGDGELKMIHGSGYVRQTGSMKLAIELHDVITNPHRQCIVGIPTMNPDSPKRHNWDRHRERFLRVLSPRLKYYSAFISRPDSAPWIENEKFVASVQKVWAGKRVVVLCEANGSILRAVRASSQDAIHVECPFSQSYDIIDTLQARIVKQKPEVVVMSCGPSATCLANRFAAIGIHAIDIGSAGQFLLRHMR